MCGFAGVLDLEGRRTVSRVVVERMADAIRHRGPDENGWFADRGLGIAHRRLSIVGLADGQQPIYNEEHTVAVMFNGELFDFPEQRARLESKGHTFRTHTDTEIIVHLYEEYGESLFEHLRGQFAIALYDLKERKLLLARDRTGICPLHFARHGDWLYFGSEIKALLASGAITPQLDPKGLDHIFTFFAMGRRRTMFKGVEAVLPGHYLAITLDPTGRPAQIRERRYWDLDFPDLGDEEDPVDERPLVDEFEATFKRAVEVRLRADVPVVGYLSGGIDSAAVLSQAVRVMGRQIPSFTVKVPGKELDESDKAMLASRHIGTIPHMVEAGPELISRVYPDLVSAADSPVVDTACAALHALAKAVHDAGFKVALTGEGADEALAGYVWFKIQKIIQGMGAGPLQPGLVLNKLARKLADPSMPFAELSRIDQLMGGAQAQSSMWQMMGASRQQFYNRDLLAGLDGHTAYDDLELDGERMRRWHPLNQSLYVGYKVFLAGLLLNHKGDRVAMSNSVETRYPFLDENVIAMMARLHPRYKLRGLRMDKYLLRRAAERWLPQEIALRPKAMFRAPFGESFVSNAPAYVGQLLSEESLRKTGYFDVEAVRRFYARVRMGKVGRIEFFTGMGLTAVLATQLWHHQNMGGGLCELPYRVRTRIETPAHHGETIGASAYSSGVSV